MGEAKNRSRSRKEILAGEPRCIYCTAKANSVEHMPPTSMFTGKIRLSGLEFPSCVTCNNDTRAADAAAAFFARIAPVHNHSVADTEEAYDIISTFSQHAPDLISEIFLNSPREDFWAQDKTGIYHPYVQLTLEGPTTHAIMTAFSAKLGMALYAEHMGKPLEDNSVVFTRHYFNSSIAQHELDELLGLLPKIGELQQGRKTSRSQFAYKYAIVTETTILIMASFRNNLFIRALATNESERFNDTFLKETSSDKVRLGELSKLAASWKPK